MNSAPEEQGVLEQTTSEGGGGRRGAFQSENCVFDFPSQAVVVALEVAVEAPVARGLFVRIFELKLHPLLERRLERFPEFVGVQRVLEFANFVLQSLLLVHHLLFVLLEANDVVLT